MDLLTLIIIGWIISAIFGNKKKADQKKQAERKAMGEAFGRGVEPAAAKPASAAKPAAPKPAAPKPAPATMLPPRSGLHDTPAPAMTVAQPRVHTHLAPDCEVHDKPGSLGVASLEGKDLCHESQLQPANKPRPTITFPKEESGLSLEWSGENMVKAFVMQEVLTRPCERRKRA